MIPIQIPLPERVGKRGPAKGTGGRPRTQNPKPDGNGYCRTTVGPPGHGKLQQAHRVIAYGGTVGGLVMAPPSSKSAKEGVIDHVNGVRHDNRPENLEIVTKAVNSQRAAAMRKARQS